MKIGIVTIMDYTNYGNRLQNYAVQQVLKTRFHCEVVSLVSYKAKPFYDGNYIEWIKDQVVKKMCIVPKLAEKRFGANVTRWANFQSWSRKIKTRNYYESTALSSKLNKEYDYFFVGSDQVWNYHFSSSRFEDYFLKFAEDSKKVAISASFGVADIPESWKEEYIKGLKSFKHISVREEAGKIILQRLLDRDVPVLIDPTMMLSKEEWLKVSRKPRVNCSKPYILKYYLGDESEETKIDDWAKRNGYLVYELLNDKIPELYSAGPGEFISLINNATMVCSDSFHCIVFSIIFSKPFLVYARQGKEDYMTSRIDTLLNKFGFQNRWKHILQEEEYLSCDFSSTERIIKEEQTKFMEYVSEVLK